MSTQARITIDGEPVSRPAELHYAMLGLFDKVLEFEAVEPETGVWLVNLPWKFARELATEGYLDLQIEFSGFAIQFEAEMP